MTSSLTMREIMEAILFPKEIEYRGLRFKFGDLIDGQRTGIKVYLGSNVIGSFQFDDRSENGVSIHIILFPSFKGKGYGRIIYDFCEEYLKSIGKKFIPNENISSDAQRIWKARNTAENPNHGFNITNDKISSKLTPFLDTAKLSEAINIPYGFDIFKIIDDCIKKSNNDINKLRSLLQDHIGAFLKEKSEALKDDPKTVGYRPLKFFIHEGVEGYMSGGFFRDDSEIANIEGLPKVEPGTTEIYMILDDFDLQMILAGRPNIIKMFGSNVKHEFVHYVQYIRAKKYSPKKVYTRATKRPKIDGKRVGKRGGYESNHQMTYMGMDNEIEANAAASAMQFIHTIQNETPENQREAIKKFMNTMRDGSNFVLNQYREIFRGFSLPFGDPKNSARNKAAKDRVWKLFRVKLAKHLMDYLREI